ncbi:MULTISPECIES: NHLP family bacteriocin export ABC transporter peptidase/permease/ATPase subunit [Nostoc]|uniref:NHLP family bacteriocin export ABC transporter peptidase/permease/ATPase subunit n=1 Tax=Nostoc paludosum FACHB-159 TaxID=2692908 RepID=A0ABR8KIE1_9NOSO|nr:MULTISPECIES: NHLP family bacteriocin export ABC transporter peptidase/permease/ATPase subunit [Nostoc]MBD2679333.1 NHLP family bacteriocin export ABC transporter peptidase/permease/ATPase subunit [Nostoc sp. FACHB-857]MBD2738566.1 NHLP family bacteriocin export ABC transporter peptidase/permease/ATPase subunit [Nostoc paludosum FACHB-159]
MVSTKSTLVTPINLWQYLQKLLSRGKLRVKTPTLLQMEAVECGAAALGIILGYYDRIVPLPQLRRDCGVSRDGSKASNMVKAAKNYGLEAKGFKKELKHLWELRPPYIVFWNFNHFLVVEGWNKQRVYLNDPATGPRHVSLQEFDEGYTGVVLVMEPGAKFTKGGSKPSMILSLWSRLQGAGDALIYSIVAGFLLTVVGLVVPVFTQVFVDDILVQGRQLWLRPLLLAMAIAAILQGSLTLLRLRYLRRLKIKLAVGMSSRFLWYILRLPVSFYAQRFAGEISNRTTLNDQVADVLAGKLATTIIDTLMVVFYALVMMQYDWVLTLIAVSFAAVNVLTLQWISRQRIDANQRLIQEYGKAAGASIAALQSIETLKASGLESDFFSRWSGYYTKALNSQQELGVTNQTFSVLPALLSALSSMLLLVVGGLRVMDGHLSIGMLIAFQGLMLGFQQPVNNLVNFGTTLQELEGNLIRLDDVLDNSLGEAEEQGSRGAGEQIENSSPVPLCTSALLAKLQGYVELRNITFGYSRLELPLIENFNLSIKPGQRIALVGGSGSGKSTIAKLVSGLYQPWTGEVCFDGQPRKEIPQQLLTNSVAMVEQEILLFGGTVRDNLTLWDTTIPDKNLMRACQDAAIADVILSMSGGLDAQLIEGAANLSGGQRQRLEIARALVNNPSILVMDEATSALDAETEQIIDQNLRRRGCTCIIVAHRLSTIRDCDRIIVLERGKVIQQGTHQELWQMEGVYSRLIRNS